MANIPSSPPKQQTPIAQDIFCQNCGYNLRSLTSDQCPECGRSLEGIRSETTRIPWVHRKKIGWFRAYWKTVRFVMFQQKEFCDEMARPTSFAASQGFRWTTVAFAYLPVLAADLMLWIERMPSPTDNEFITMFWSNVGLAAILHVGFLLFLVAATGAPSYFFHPRDVPIAQQDRAIALSYYACGPLSLLFLPAVAAMIWLHVGLDHWIGELGLLLMVILPILQ
ncbi:MAG: zinc ribbon domain-containing protein, partial [Phycisphaerales bacterium]|nr:zinc ribbon domain-containing protein [Phycisphaerales bacterium]